MYLPAYNDSVRQKYVKKGLTMLSEAQGDFAEAGENGLRLMPPSDATIQRMVTELSARVKAHDDLLAQEVEDVRELLRDQLIDPDERRLYTQKLRQLNTRRAKLANDQPTVAEAKSYFYRVHRMALAAGVDPSFRIGMQAMQQEQQWAQLQAEVDREVRQAQVNEPPAEAEPWKNKGGRPRKVPVAAE